MKTDVVDQRQRCVRDRLSEQWAMSELCERYGISRPTEVNPITAEVRRVSATGTISWSGRPLFLSEVLGGEDVALEEIAEGVWKAYSPKPRSRSLIKVL